MLFGATALFVARLCSLTSVGSPAQSGAGEVTASVPGVSKDRLHHFSVATRDRSGRHDPPDIDKAPVDQRILADTGKPVVKVRSAEWVGDEMQVEWEAQEAYPDWSSLKLEYRVGATTEPWTPLPVQRGERGSVRFMPHTRGEVTLRLVLRDLAGNEGVEEKVVRARSSGVKSARRSEGMLLP